MNYSLVVSRRAALLGLSAALATPSIARAQTALTITDAVGRTVALKKPAERIVLCFNFEEFTAIGGAAGWDRMIGYSKSQWSDNRASVFKRYSAVIPRIASLPDVGNNEAATFSLE